MKAIADWFDARLGYRAITAAFRARVLPSGPSWWLTSASCLFWLFVIEAVTGLLLMATYSPSMTNAWASVHFIDQTDAGRFLRGVHHFTSHALIILLVLHVARVLVTAAFRAPRELIWATGLFLIPLMVVWTVTGNPLSGSQKGMVQIEVEGNILGSLPVVGNILRRLLIGGDQVGNLTLTHLYFLHVALLPLLVGVVLALHLQQVYRHNVRSTVAPPAATAPAKTPVPYWPHQTARNSVVLATLVGVIAWLSWSHGAPLDAPANPDLASTPRPEWYFRWLFELRRHFTGEREFIATMVVPAAILAFFLMLPLLDRRLSGRTGAVFRTSVLAVSLAGWGWLTYTSFQRDWTDQQYLASVSRSREIAERARVLADAHQVGVGGASVLLKQDPKTQGPLLFARHCAQCHSFLDAEGRGIASDSASAPNLYGFGTAAWIDRLLDAERILDSDLFGVSERLSGGDMVGAVQGLFESAGEEGTAALRENLRLVALALESEAQRPSSRPHDPAEIARGRELLTAELGCTDCHRFGDTGELGSAPDLTGYGSREWLVGMISDPAGERFYPNDLNDRMPAFAADPAHPDWNLLTPSDLNLLVDWLREEWYEPQPPDRLSADSDTPEIAER